MKYMTKGYFDNDFFKKDYIPNINYFYYIINEYKIY